MADKPERREVLVIRGKLDRAGRFRPGRSRSTPTVLSWPVVESSDVFVELLDEQGRVLHREAADVRPDVDCDPGDPDRFRVTAYIELREEATEVRLMRGDLELWRDRIGEAASLKLELGRAARKRIVLRADYSEPREFANMLVVFQWGEGQFEPIYVGPPQREIAVDLTDMPGGPRCRLVVTYSDGLRSASAATKAFEVPRRGPSVTIARPTSREKVVADTPVILEGGVIDRERRGGPRPEESLVWLLDGEEVGRGPITSIDGVGDGRHVAELVYHAEPGASAKVEFVARASKQQRADDWAEWNPLLD